MFPETFYKPQRIRTLLVANRGEIAVRVIRAAQELGMRAAVTVSDADRDSLAVRMADQAVPTILRERMSITAVNQGRKAALADNPENRSLRTQTSC